MPSTPERRTPPSPVGDPAGWDADAAVTALYGAHWRRMVRLGYLLLRDESMAEEIAQDAFVALHARWSRLGEPNAALGYLRACVVNGARSALRHRNVVERLRQPGAPPPAGPEERALQAVQDARVLSLLRALPQRQREVLVLRYYADLTEVEVAEALGISRGAVKSHGHRAMAALRAALTADLSPHPTGPDKNAPPSSEPPSVPSRSTARHRRTPPSEERP